MKKRFRVILAIVTCLASASLAGAIQPERILAQSSTHVNIKGTAVEPFADPGLGAPSGWIVDAEHVVFENAVSSQSADLRVRVGLQAYLPAGMIDPAIQPGDDVEVRGILNPHGSDPTYVGLNGEDCYLVRVAAAKPPTIDNVVTCPDPKTRTADSRPTRLTVRADVTDDEGLAWVRLHVRRLRGSSRYVKMLRASGDTYQTTIDICSEPIILSYVIEARDLDGNVARSATYALEAWVCEGLKQPDKRPLPPRLSGFKGDEPDVSVLYPISATEKSELD